jgi:3-deoxy-D-manno-octulosonic-acid transferase
MARDNVLPVLTFLYRLGWMVARPFAAPLARTGSKLARSLRGRRAAVGALAHWASRARDDSQPLVWFHAASVGEGRQAEAVLRRLRAARPRWQLLYTFSSSSAERFAAALPADASAYVPFDTVKEAGAALDAVRPTALVFSATDIWPELVRQAAARGVALGVVSATLAPTSSRRGVLARRLLAPAYAALDRVGAIDRADAEGLERLGVPGNRITVTGDTRYDAALERLAGVSPEAPHVRALTRAGGDARPIVMAGSTWPSDELVLLPALSNLRKRGTSFRLVIAPHEPTPGYLSALEQRIQGHLGAAVRAVRLSSLAAGTLSPGTWDVALVDTVGVLAELYRAASIAYVGGGFHRAGLHAVIEPAAAGVPVLFGPRWRGSRDARLLIEAGGARSVADSAELDVAFTAWLTNETARATAAAAARAVVERGRGAAGRSLQLVIELVERRPSP